MLRFGFCGVGGFVEKGVLPAISGSGQARAVALFDLSGQRRQQVGDAFHIERRFSTYEDLLACDEVDVVYVASPNRFHRGQAIAAAQAGKHVFCQKPMGLNARECSDMLDAVAAANVRLGVGFCFRYAGAQQKVRELLDAGDVGTPCALHMSFNFHGYTPETVGWRCDARLAGGGPMMDLAPHMVDLACWFLKAQVESVMAYVSPEKTDERIEEDALAILQMTNGTSALLDTSFNRRGDGAFYRVVGTQGAIRRDGIDAWHIGGREGAPLFLEKAGEAPQRIAYPVYEYLQNELDAFCLAVERDAEPPVSGCYGMEIQRVIDALYESGRTGRRCR